MKFRALVGSLALVGLASHALAQDATQRVTITGSSIKRIAPRGRCRCRSSPPTNFRARAL